MNHIWVIEMCSEIHPKWWPTVGVGLDREQAREKLAEWRKRNPFDQFRIAKYEATK